MKKNLYKAFDAEEMAAMDKTSRKLYKRLVRDLNNKLFPLAYRAYCLYLLRTAF